MEFIAPQNLQDFSVVVLELQKRNDTNLWTNIISREIIVLEAWGYTDGSTAFPLGPNITFLEEDDATAIREGYTKGNIYLMKKAPLDTGSEFVTGDNLRALLSIGVVPSWLFVTCNRLNYYDAGGTITGGYVVCLVKK